MFDGLRGEPLGLLQRLSPHGDVMRAGWTNPLTGRPGHPAGLGLVRSAIRKDLLFFGLPAFPIFVAGLIVSGSDGWRGLSATVRDLIRHSGNVAALPIHEVAGLALIAAGLVIMFVAVGTLRRCYSSSLVIRECHRLVTRGIYRFVRHPVYLGALMVCIGIPVHASSLYGCLVMAALVPFVLIRIRIEERLLTEAFGDAHRAYRKATRKLIPFIY